MPKHIPQHSPFPQQSLLFLSGLIVYLVSVFLVSDTVASGRVVLGCPPSPSLASPALLVYQYVRNKTSPAAPALRKTASVCERGTWSGAVLNVRLSAPVSPSCVSALNSNTVTLGTQGESSWEQTHTHRMLILELK